MFLSPTLLLLKVDKLLMWFWLQMKSVDSRLKSVTPRIVYKLAIEKAYVIHLREEQVKEIDCIVDTKNESYNASNRSNRYNLTLGKIRKRMIQREMIMLLQ